MRFLPDWRSILRRAWSIRLMLLAGVLSGVEVAMPFLEDVVPVERGTFAALAGLATTGAFVTRLLAQSNLPRE